MKKKVGIIAAVSAIIILCAGAVGVWYLTRGASDSPLEAAIDRRIEGEKNLGKDLPLSMQYSNAVLDALEYRVLSEDHESGTATVSFTYVDVMKLGEECGTDIADADLFYTQCMEKIEQGTAPSVTKEIQLQYTTQEATDGESVYVIQSSPELADALSGVVFSVYQGLVGGES